MSAHESKTRGSDRRDETPRPVTAHERLLGLARAKARLIVQTLCENPPDDAVDAVAHEIVRVAEEYAERRVAALQAAVEKLR